MLTGLLKQVQVEHKTFVVLKSYQQKPIKEIADGDERYMLKLMLRDLEKKQQRIVEGSDYF
jgi:hypothetical protein